MSTDRAPVERHRRILEELKARGPRTARELTKLLGGRPAVLRAYLRYLHAAGWVEFTEERQALGRPSRRFRLTPAADALFPRRYDLLSVRFAEAIVARLGPAALDGILRAWQKDLARHLEGRLPEEPKRRLAALAEHQSEYGFMAAVQRDAGGAALVERNCPIADVARRFPRICDYEAGLFRRVLGEPVTLSSCQAKGDGLCRFRIGEAGRLPK